MTVDTIRMPHGWKTVPVPAIIDALPKDRRGFPIPWVADWSSGSKKSFSVHEVGPGLPYGRDDCDCTPGVGEPILGRQCPVRQRQAMTERLCQVCGLGILATEDLHFLGGDTIKVYVEPPLHAECAAYSLQVCPGIVRREGMSVHVARNVELCHQFIVFQGDDDITLFTPFGERPPLTTILPSVLVFHGALPIEGQRFAAAQWLTTYTEEIAHA